MGVEDLLKRKIQGDWGKVSEKTGLSTTMCIYAAKRVSSKHHVKVLRALREVIEEREKEIREALGEAK